MGLQRVIELVGKLEKELVLFNIEPTDTITDQLSAHFKTHNVRISAVQTASGQPTDVAVLSNDSEVLEILSVDILREFVDHSLSQFGTIGIADDEFRSLLSHLKETTFQSYDTEEMLYASREIEDRARRIASGTIHAGFQQCSLMDDQQAIYTDLARRGLEVHTYGVPDISPPDLGEAQIHTTHADEIANIWFVVFDGDGDDAQKTALVAEEIEEDIFCGAWTYDPSLVDTVIDHLESTYTSDETRTRSKS